MHVCPRCHGANPAEAAFCHFDGARLAGGDGAATAPSNRLPHPFVLASGRRCHTYDELVAACQDEWAAARDLLREGAFRQFLTGAGRLDLAKAAEEARQHPDADVGLDTFLGRLPTLADPPKPCLELEPRRLLLGDLRSGETMDVQFRVLNLGRGLLHGTLTVVQGGDWLRITGDDGGACELKTIRDQIVTLHVTTKGLPAPHAYGASLKVITNGGIVEVPVRLNVTAIPFTKAPYQGAAGPRDLAVRIRGNPKPAVALLESGEISRWFLDNGWGYPVNGPPAKGMAAVQQFFESMGLAKPPAVTLAETEAQFTCTPPDSAVGHVTLQTADRKWVYGRAASDATWLKVTSPIVSGPQRATIHFQVDSSGLPAGIHEGTLHVIGNAGQTRQMRVRLDVVRPATRVHRVEQTITRPPPPTVRPVQAVVLPEAPAEKRSPPAPVTAPGLGRAILMGAIVALLLRLLLALPADIYARVLATPGSSASVHWENPSAGSHFVKHFVLATWWIGAVAGAVWLGKRGSHWADVPCGVIAGAAAGVALSGTLACMWPIFDWLPRQIWNSLAVAKSHGSAALTAVAYIGVAVVSWAAIGACAGFLLGVWGRLFRREAMRRL